MKPWPHFACYLIAASMVGAATAAGAVPTPDVDPGRIINDSYAFLRDREPEMTETEYALYERAVPMAKSQPDFALKMLETMMTDDTPESPAFEFALANIYFEKNRVDLAEQHFRNAVERYPNFLRAWNNLGALYYASDRFAEAVPCLARAVELGDRSAQTLGLLGFCLYRTDNPLAAELVYMQALAVDPNNPEWIAAVVNLLVGNREYARAEPLARALVRLKPGEPENWRMLASILVSSGRDSEAAAVIEVAVGLGVTDADLLQVLGDLYHERKFEAEALAVYRRLAALGAPQSIPRLLRQVQTMVAGGDLPAAEGLLDTIPPPSTREDRILYLQTKAQILLAHQAWAAARDQLEELLQLDPLDGQALMMLARTHKEEGHDAQAELVFAEASRQPGFTCVASLELAGLAVKARDYARAAEHLERAAAVESTPELRRHLALVRSMISSHEEPGTGN